MNRHPPTCFLSVAELIELHNAAVAVSEWLVRESHRLMRDDHELGRRWIEAVRASREVLARTAPRGEVNSTPGS